jgi:phosphatidylglycerol---prolipoprotein diacylglyceryl transferase
MTRRMRQVLFTIPIFGGVKVFGYGAMLVLAFLSSTWLAYWRAKRERLDPEVIADMSFWLFLFGLVGARLFYCIEYWGDDIKSLWDVVQYWKGGVVYYGGIIGGVAAFFVYRWLRPFPLRPYMDAVAPAIAIGTLFGRLGCFLNGCCFGDICQLPWAVSFPQHSPPWAQQYRLGQIGPNALGSLPVHPTQLYSAIDALVIFLLLSAFYPLRRRDGEVIGLLMFVYPVTRFAIEYLRNDEGVFFAGMTISQTISVALVLAGCAFWAWLSTRPKGLYRDHAALGERSQALPLATARS